MGWARLDDGYAMHPKLIAAGLEARGLDVAGICYSQSQLTDGFVPDAMVSMLAGDAKRGQRIACRLIDVGRWVRDDDRRGYLIHDYLEFNESRKQVEARRAAERDRKAAGRIKQGRDPLTGRLTSGRNPGGIRAESGRIPAGVPPVPPHPTLLTSPTPPETPPETHPTGGEPEHTRHPDQTVIDHIAGHLGWTGPMKIRWLIIEWDYGLTMLDRRYLEDTLLGCKGARNHRYLRQAIDTAARKAGAHPNGAA